MRLAVRVTPRGGRDAVEGWSADAAGRAVLRVRVCAPASDGAANAALTALIAEALCRPKSAVQIVAGTKARHKVLEISGVGPQALAQAFGAPPQD